MKDESLLIFVTKNTHRIVDVWSARRGQIYLESVFKDEKVNLVIGKRKNAGTIWRVNETFQPL